jgi:hypothetical protein
MDKNVEEQTVQATEKSEVKNTQEKNLLFGTIGYTDDTAYEKFISEMNINQSIFILMAAANFAQAKGSFNLLESETLANAIRTIKKSTEQQVEDTPTEPSNT